MRGLGHSSYDFPLTMKSSTSFLLLILLKAVVVANAENDCQQPLNECHDSAFQHFEKARKTRGAQVREKMCRV